MECRLSVVFTLRIYSRPNERGSMRGEEEQWIYWEESIWCRAAQADGQMCLMCIRLHIQWHLTLELSSLQSLGDIDSIRESKWGRVVDEIVLLISEKQNTRFVRCKLVQMDINWTNGVNERHITDIYIFFLQTKSISLFPHKKVLSFVIITQI